MAGSNIFITLSYFIGCIQSISSYDFLIVFFCKKGNMTSSIMLNYLRFFMAEQLEEEDLSKFEPIRRRIYKFIL